MRIYLNACFSQGRCKAEVLLQCVPDNNDSNQPSLSWKVNDAKKKNKFFVLETPIGCLVPPAVCVVSIYIHFIEASQEVSTCCHSLSLRMNVKLLDK